MEHIWRDYGETYADQFGIKSILGEFDDVCFIRSAADGSSQVFVCWKPYLDSMMEGVHPGSNGWSALALEYHCGSTWDHEKWQMPDVLEVFTQLRAIDHEEILPTPFGREAAKILPDLLAFLETAVNTRQSVTVVTR